MPPSLYRPPLTAALLLLRLRQFHSGRLLESANAQTHVVYQRFKGLM